VIHVRLDMTLARNDREIGYTHVHAAYGH
jgi:hypothetical protein